jgi:subtilisin family serine protease
VEPLEERLLLNAGVPVWAADNVSGTVTIPWHGETRTALAGQWVARFAGVSGSVQDQIGAIQQLLRARNLSVQVNRHLGLDGLVQLETPPDWTAEQLEAVLRGLPGYQYLEPNFIQRVVSVFPNDPSFASLYGLHNTGQSIPGLGAGTPGASIHAPEAWDLTTGSRSVVVASLDSGVAYNHPDLAANMWRNPGEIPGNGVDDDGNGFVDDVFGYDFVNRDGDPLDDLGHGTHTAGTIGAVGNNAVGVVGVNWTVSIMAVKWIDQTGLGTTANAIAAINYATLMRNRGVNLRVTNNSWALPFSAALRDAIRAHGDAGILFVAAAGNTGQDNDVFPVYPASYDLPNILSVAATDNRDQRASFSSFGRAAVDLGAPGVEVLSTLPGSAYGFESGTSMAAPHVAGVAALAWSLAPNAPYQQIRDALLAGVDPVPALAGRTVTGGRLNALGTLRTLGMQVVATTPAAGSVITTRATDFVLDFSDPYRAGSVDAGALRVNGIAADAVSLTDADTLTFQYTVSPVTAQGPQTVALAAGAVLRDRDGDPVRAFTGTFLYDAGLRGPRILASTPSGATAAPVSSVRVTFNTAIDPATFTAADVVSFTGPGGTIAVTGIAAVAGSGDTQFELTFDPQSASGTYTLVLGPDIRDPAGNPMDQNNNLVLGEVPQDRFTATFLIAACLGPDGFGFSACQAAFEDLDLEPGQPGVFTVLNLTDDGTAAVNLGSNTFTFYGATYTGANQLYVSSNGLITFGSGTNAYLNADLTSGPVQRAIAVLWDDWVKSSGSPMVLGKFEGVGDGDPSNDRLLLEWNDVAHFNTDGSNRATFQAILRLNTGGRPGTVTLNYRDLDVGNPGFTNGGSATVGLKDAGAQGANRLLVSFNDASGLYVASGRAVQFANRVGGPVVVFSSPAGPVTGPVASVRVTFDRALDPTTFTPADVVSFSGPAGTIAVTGVAVVSGTGNTQFDLTFAAQSASGTYTLVLGPDVRDPAGNPMDQNRNGTPGEVPSDRYTATFAVISGCLGPDGFGYQACLVPVEDLNLELGQAGVFTVLASSFFNDDVTVSVSLGADSFNFYGTVYTSLLVSSNGLITFGTGNASPTNDNLMSFPPQRVLAPLWDDWIKLSGSPMILGKFEDTNGDAVNDRLILEWNDVRGFLTSPSGVTFQAILQLNTGTAVAGAITYNYPDLDAGDFRSNGGSATVGLKDAGAQGANRLLVSFNSGSGLFVQTGRAVRIAPVSGGGGGLGLRGPTGASAGDPGGGGSGGRPLSVDATGSAKDSPALPAGSVAGSGEDFWAALGASSPPPPAAAALPPEVVPPADRLVPSVDDYFAGIGAKERELGFAGPGAPAVAPQEDWQFAVFHGEKDWSDELTL